MPSVATNRDPIVVGARGVPNQFRISQYVSGAMVSSCLASRSRVRVLCRYMLIQIVRFAVDVVDTEGCKFGLCVERFI